VREFSENHPFLQIGCFFKISRLLSCSQQQQQQQQQGNLTTMQSALDASFGTPINSPNLTYPQTRKFYRHAAVDRGGDLGA